MAALAACVKVRHRSATTGQVTQSEARAGVSWQPSMEPDCTDRADEVELLIWPRDSDLDGLTIRRLLPSAKRRLVGPYVFFDHFGPFRFPAGQGIDVRPHPHIGLATVTYLFNGEIMHRDSLGCVQAIRPGAVNLMVAGRGIVHSERTPPERRQEGAELHGIQLWLALPADQEATDPAFTHYPADDIPMVEGEGLRITVIMGEAFGVRSPVRTFSPTLYIEALFAEPGRLSLPASGNERAVYLVEGRAALGACPLEPGTMAVIRPAAEVSIEAEGPARAMIIGGEPFAEKRTIWWNFVSTSRDRIEKAKRDWREGRFDPVPGETELTPLPD